MTMWMNPDLAAVPSCEPPASIGPARHPKKNSHCPTDPPVNEEDQVENCCRFPWVEFWDYHIHSCCCCFCCYQTSFHCFWRTWCCHLCKDAYDRRCCCCCPLNHGFAGEKASGCDCCPLEHSHSIDWVDCRQDIHHHLLAAPQYEKGCLCGVEF